MTRPDAFLPPVDIVVPPEEYIIVIDIPGIKKEDIVLKRRNVVTLVKGVRRKSKISQHFDPKSYDKAERKFGEFNLNFKIPEEFERKWYFFEVKNGTMCIKYKRDMDGENSE